MDSSPNPYQPPPFDPKHFQDQPAQVGSAPSDSGWVNQVRLFAVLNAVQGILEIPVALYAIAMGVLVPAMSHFEKIQNAQKLDDDVAQMPAWFLWTVAGMYLTLGALVLVFAVLRLIAGFQNYRLKGRRIGMTSIIGGLVSMLTFCCLPTAIGLVVYGLVLFLNPAVKAAFQMVEQGHSVEQVLAAFSPYPQQTYYQPPAPPTAPPGAPPTPLG